MDNDDVEMDQGTDGFISQKEMAKFQAAKSNNWTKFNRFETQLIKKDQFKFEDYADEESIVRLELEEAEDLMQENEINRLIEDVWEDFQKDRPFEPEQKRKRQDEVNQKLVQYLRQNSQFVSSKIQEFLEKQ